MISVIVPVYNAAEYIAECIDSILLQSFDDFELLLIDDGSVDGSAAALDDYARKDSRIRVFHRSNSGVSGARNFGLLMAQGAQIAFIDADDTVSEDYLEKLNYSVSVKSADMSVCTVCHSADKNGRYTVKPRLIKADEAIELILSRKEINSGPCGKLFSADKIKNITFPELKAYEDIVFVLNAVDRCESVGVCDAVYTYRDNPQGAMHKFFKAPSEDIITATAYILDYLSHTRRALTGEPFYVTVSHLKQNADAFKTASADKKAAAAFNCKVKRLYRKYLRDFLKCDSFPLKEKLYYLIYMFGFTD